MKGYKVNIRRGHSEGTPKPKAAGNLYPNPLRNWSMRPRFYSVQDTTSAVDMSTRWNMLRYSRELYASMGNIGGAIVAKNDWAFTDGFKPCFLGENQAWGDTVETWLVNRFFPVCNTRGANNDFNTTLFLLGCALDVDGDALVVLTNTRDGFPKVQIVPSHRIGTRTYGDTEVTSGRYKGLRIVDGVILGPSGTPVGYRILGDTPADDYDISAQSALLLAEHQWADTYRGIPKLARIVLDLLDSQDIDFFLKRTVKLDSSQGIMHHTVGGEPDAGATLAGITEDSQLAGLLAPSVTGVTIQELQGGEYIYATAGKGEKIEPFKTDRPHPNVESFVSRIERRSLYALGWPYELLDPSKIGGASVRLIQDLARKSVRTRQATVERAARFIITYAVAKGMDLGIIPENYDDTWYNFGFTRPAAISVDAGNESKADNEGLKLGTTTLADVTAKQGKDWYEVRNQTQKEVEDLLNRAQAISKRYTITFEKALSLLSQRTPNEAPPAGDSNAS